MEDIEQARRRAVEQLLAYGFATSGWATFEVLSSLMAKKLKGDWREYFYRSPKKFLKALIDSLGGETMAYMVLRIATKRLREIGVEVSGSEIYEALKRGDSARLVKLVDQLAVALALI